MQTLGLAESTPKPENRLKSLFWPTIQSGADVDYLGAQGYWVCTLIAAGTSVFLFARGHEMLALVLGLFLYLGGVGVRERSRAAAMIVFLFYAADTLTSGISIVRIIFGALLLSNVRAIWMAADWTPDSEEAALPPRLGDTWSDKFADQLPAWLWPKTRVFYFVLSAAMFALLAVGISAMILHGKR